MALLKFELTKLYKNKLVWLYLSLGLGLVVVFFLFNLFNLSATQAKLLQETQTIQETTYRHLDSLDYLIMYETEEEPLADLEETRSILLAIADNSAKLVEALEEGDNDRYLIKKKTEFKLLNDFNKSSDAGLLGRYPYNETQTSNNLKLTDYLLTNQLVFEDGETSVNQPNFIYLLGKNIFSVAGILFLVVLLNLPLLLEFSTGNLKFLFLELKNNQKPSVIFYHFYQLCLLLLLLVSLFATAFGVTSFFGQGLITNRLNSFAYPLEIRGNSVLTITDVVANWVLISLPILFLFSQLLQFLLMKFRHVLFSVTALLFGALALWQLSKVVPLLQGWFNPWYLMGASTFITQSTLIVSFLYLVVLNLVASAILTVTFKRV